MAGLVEEYEGNNRVHFDRPVFCMSIPIDPGHVLKFSSVLNTDERIKI